MTVPLIAQPPVVSIAVLLDPARFHATPHALRDLHAAQPADDAAIVAALERLLAKHPSAIAVAGDDRFLARIATCHWRHLRHLPLVLAPLVAGAEAGMVAAGLRVPDEVEVAADRLLAADRRGKLTRVSHPSLRVTCSAMPAAQLAFGVGALAITALVEAARRSVLPGKVGKGAALAELVVASGSSQSADQRPRILHGGRPLEDDALLVAATPRGLFGLDLGDDPAPRLRTARSASELASAIARSRAPLAALRGRDQVRPLTRLVADGLDSWVQDGVIITPGAPSALQIQPGPPIPMMMA